MSPGRLETLADGVFAIAATLLILNVDEQASTGLKEAWPAYVGYGVSFITIGIIWVNHHLVMDQMTNVDRKFMFINIGFLMCVAFVPLPTRLVADALAHGHEGHGLTAGLTYGFTMTATAIFFNLMWLYGSRGGRLLRDDADPRVVSGITRSYRPGPWIYLAATLITFASPGLAFILYAAIAAFYVVESSFFARAPSEA